jgi:hypothetical protein
MVKLNYTKNRSYAIEHTFREHRKPKVGDLVLALDYSLGCDSMVIGKLVGIENNSEPRGPFRVKSLEWKNCDAFLWQQAYKIPEGLVTVETND